MTKNEASWNELQAILEDAEAAHKSVKGGCYKCSFMLLVLNGLQARLIAHVVKLSFLI